MSKSLDPQQNVEQLKADVASFASSLGLVTSSLPSSGFNDTDFRKPNKPRKEGNTNRKNNRSEKSKGFDDKKENSKPELKSGNNQKPNQIPPASKSSFLSLDDDRSTEKSKRFEKYKKLPKLPLVKANKLGSEWFKDAAELEEKVFGEGGRDRNLSVKNVDEWKGVVEKKKEVAERLVWQYTQDFDASKGKSGDMKMVIAAQKSGTEDDKVTAFEIMIGENPIANMRSLDALLGMVTSKVGKRYAFKGFKALTELFIKLLPDRKLKTLLQRPVNNLPETKDGYSLLLFWYWEECLKQRYGRYIVALEEASRDMLPQLKDKALKTMYVLLSSKSEQERKLLSGLVNKLGDPQNKSASNAEYHLSNLLADHPNMKAVVIEEVDTFLFRPHLGLRAKYHAVNFLSQFRLDRQGDGPKVAKRLIDVYFALFKVLITDASGNEQEGRKAGNKNASKSHKESKEKSSTETHVEMDSRLLSALLTGVNRAFPYVSSNESNDVIEEQTPILFKLVHSKNFNVGVQALMLLDKISSKNQVVSDRFYRALYSKLLLPSAMNSSKAEMFIGLLLRAMKNDVNLKRVCAFSKRLLQVALQQPPQYACGCLFLLSEVLKARPPLWNMVLQNESVDDDVEHFEDIVEENDKEPNKAAKKEDVVRPLAPAAGEVANSDGESSEGEDKLPASDSEEEDDASDGEEDLLIRDHSENFQDLKIAISEDGLKPQIPPTKAFLPGGYNPPHREPSFCNANRVSWWELMVLSTHVHPSVATMAMTLLSGANIVYNGNPLIDLTLTAFLDKFMEKKAKATSWHGASQIEPAKKLDMSNHLLGPDILSLAESDVPPEDLVFHKFYANKMTSSKKYKKKKKKLPEEEAAEDLFNVDGGDDDVDEDGDDAVDGGEESDNEEIENMLDVVDPETDGEYDYDDLDRIAGEDDDELVGNASDVETDLPSDFAEDDEFEANLDDDDSSDELLKIGDAEDISDDEPELDNRKRKRGKGSKASPFASLEEYEHLMDEEDSPIQKESTKKKGGKQHRKKKKKSSK